jgi:hypothetical protein
MSRQNSTLRFIIAPQTQIKILGFIRRSGHTSALRDNLENDIRRIGKAAVLSRLGPILPVCAARRAICELGDKSQRTARAHVAMLIDAGVLISHGAGMIRLAEFRGSINGGAPKALPRDPAYWRSLADERKAKRRAADALRKAKGKRASEKQSAPKRKNFPAESAKSPAILEPSAIVRSPDNTEAKLAAPSPSFDLPGCMHPQNTQPADCLGASVASPSLGFCGRISAQEILKLDSAELEAVEEELCAQPHAAAPSLTDDDAAIFARLRQRLAQSPPKAPPDAAQDSAWSASEPPRPLAEPVASIPCAALSGARPGKATIPEIVRLAQEHPDIDGINIVAVANLEAPYALIRQAFSLTAEARKQPQRKTGRVRNAPAFLLGTIRRLMVWGPS